MKKQNSQRPIELDAAYGIKAVKLRPILSRFNFLQDPIVIPDSIFATMWRRAIPATVLWIAFWPVFWFIKLGEITGPKSWFWIVGELNYPFALLAFTIVDPLLVRFGLKPWMVFGGNVIVVALFMVFFYPRAGFSFGVLAEAFLF